jgi:hypothetical protein
MMMTHKKRKDKKDYPEEVSHGDKRQKQTPGQTRRNLPFFDITIQGDYQFGYRLYHILTMIFQMKKDKMKKAGFQVQIISGLFIFPVKGYK